LAAADLSSLEFITYGAAPMPEELLQEVMTALPHIRLVQSYGMTEASPIITMLSWRDHSQKATIKSRMRSAGKVALLAEAPMVDADDQPVPQVIHGEVIARGHMTMLGYWR